MTTPSMVSTIAMTRIATLQGAELHYDLQHACRQELSLLTSACSTLLPVGSVLHSAASPAVC